MTSLTSSRDHEPVLTSRARDHEAVMTVAGPSSRHSHGSIKVRTLVKKQPSGGSRAVKRGECLGEWLGVGAVLTPAQLRPMLKYMCENLQERARSVCSRRTVGAALVFAANRSGFT